MGDPTTCVYQFIYNENENDETKIIQYFIQHELGLCIEVYSYMAHIFHAWSLIYNTEVSISIKKTKYFILLNACTTIFFGGSDNSNENITLQLDSFI